MTVPPPAGSEAVMTGFGTGVSPSFSVTLPKIVPTAESVRVMSSDWFGWVIWPWPVSPRPLLGSNASKVKGLPMGTYSKRKRPSWSVAAKPVMGNDAKRFIVICALGTGVAPSAINSEPVTVPKLPSTTETSAVWFLMTFA